MGKVHTKGLLVTISGLVIAAGALASADQASADSTQVQSYQRASQGAACIAQPDETPWRASWGDDPSWHPGWEQWANGGKGGWTCSRSITWAHDAADDVPAFPSGTCLYDGVAIVSLDYYVDFQGSWFVPLLSPMYSDPQCTIPVDQVVTNSFAVYAPAGHDQASAFCRQLAPGTVADGPQSADNVYRCLRNG